MSKKIIIIAAVLCTVFGLAAVYLFKSDWLPEMIRPKSADGAPKISEEHKKHEPEVAADLDVFVVNLRGSGPQRYLRTVLSVGVKDEHEREKMKEFSGPVRHTIIMYLTERIPEDLAEPSGKNKVREELQTKINEVVGYKIVSNVYFKEFLIQ